MISSVVFVSIFIFSISIFARNCKRIYRNISLGKKIPNVDKKQERIKKTLLIAFGQSKMFDRPRKRSSFGNWLFRWCDEKKYK